MKALWARMGKPPDRAPETPVGAKFEPKQPKIRRPGTGCLFQISPKKREGSYSPKLPNGKRKKFNIYTDTREECEEKLAVMIAEKNAEIAAEKERFKAGQTVYGVYNTATGKSVAVARLAFKFCTAVNKEKGIFRPHLMMWSAEYDFSRSGGKAPK